MFNFWMFCSARNRSTDGGDGGAGSGGSDGGTDSGAGGGTGGKITEPTFETVDEGKAAYKKLQEEHLKLNETSTKTAADYEKLTKKVGSQADELGHLKKLQDALAAPDKADAVKRIAELAGIDLSELAAPKEVSFEDVVKAMQDDPKLAEQLLGDQAKGAEAKFRQMLQQELAPYQKHMLDTAMEKQFGEDWDKLKDERKTLLDGLLSGERPQEEILHLAVRGEKIKDILKDHEAKLRPKIEKEVGESIRASGGSGPGPAEPKVSAEDNMTRQRTAAFAAAAAGRH